MELNCVHCHDPLARHNDKGVCFVEECSEYACSKKAAESHAVGLEQIATNLMRSNKVLIKASSLKNVEITVPGLKVSDPVNHPNHYGPLHPGGPECIEVTGWMNFNLGNAVKYCWRSGRKTPDAIEDLRKARTYIQFEIDRLTQEKE